jgi:carboxyl-terminal processing protease
VRVTTFANEKAAEDLHAALGRLEREGMQRLVLDLRDNGGGAVDEAARVASEFLPTGAVIYSAEGRKPRSRPDGAGQPLASCARAAALPRWWCWSTRARPAPSELVAGALQDHDRALIVGRPTFGKSLLMQGFPMTDGSVIVLVVGHVRTPCGRVIQRQYRDIGRREYYRLAHAARDTVGRPSCRTDGGRTVYGGGGIYPDVVLGRAEPAPLWLARLREDDVLTRWMGGWLTAQGALPTVEALSARPVLPAAALADFRAFAARRAPRSRRRRGGRPPAARAGAGDRRDEVGRAGLLPPAGGARPAGEGGRGPVRPRRRRSWAPPGWSRRGASTSAIPRVPASKIRLPRS